MDQQTNGADIIGAGARAERPHFQLALRRAATLEHHTAALRGLAQMADALACQARQHHNEAHRACDQINALERDNASLRRSIADLTDERHDLITAAIERDAALKAEADKIRLLEVERDNLKAAREAQDKALRQQDTNLAGLRADLTRTLADLRTATEAATANAAAANAAREDAAAWKTRAEEVKAELADVRQRQAAARKASKNRKRAAA